MATGSNVVSTTSQTRQDFQYSASVDGLLKQVYLPALNNVVFHGTPLMQMFGEFGGTIDFEGNKIIKAFKHQGAGGFGGISEGGNWVENKVQKGFQGYERIKYLNAYVGLTGPAARTVKEGQGAYVDAVSSALDDTLQNARMQMERIIGGQGNGVVATFTSASSDEDIPTTGKSVTLKTGTGAYTPAQWLKEGMLVDIHLASDVGTVITNSAATVVSAVDYRAGTCTLTTTDGTANLTTSTDYVLTLHKAYGETEAAGTTGTGCLEPNGLYNLVDNGDTYSTVWNLTRSTYPFSLKSVVAAAGGAELDEELVMGWILDLVNVQQSVPNVLVTDPKSRLKYFSNRKDDRRFDMTVIDSKFGFRSTGVVIDQYELALQSLTSLTPGTLFMLNTGDFKFAKATGGFQWVTGDGGGIMRQKEGSDNLYASAVNYMNFICENPNGQLKVSGLSY